MVLKQFENQPYMAVVCYVKSGVLRHTCVTDEITLLSPIVKHNEKNGEEGTKGSRITKTFLLCCFCSAIFFDKIKEKMGKGCTHMA